ncbi:MAG: universal stress protein [Rhodobacteraceae bacterium]|jgi:nucleotide-binding universal stress UspA family protein|nr:universal stress protein [Paracoccaceae bacterium]
MYNHILISTDGSELAGRGVDHGLALARALGSRVTFLVVTERFPIFAGAAGEAWTAAAAELETYETRQRELADQLLTAAKGEAERCGVPASTEHVPDSMPAPAIVETATRLGCELIVMSSHGRQGLQRLILGSQTSEVLASSTIPVLVVR